MKKLVILSTVVTWLFFLPGCKKNDVTGPGLQKAADAHVALDWYKLQLSILLERNSSLNGVHFGYIGIGLYEAVRYETKNSVSLSSQLYQMPAMPAKENTDDYNWEVSANAAMASMTRSFYGGLTTANLTTIDSLENACNQKLKSAASTEIFNRSQAFGKSIATAIYNWYLTDNLNASNTGYVPPVFPGAWVPTLPALANGINPFLSGARLFLTANSTVVAPAFPAAYSEDPNSDFYKIVKNVYDVFQTLTTDQKNTALYFVD